MKRTFTKSLLFSLISLFFVVSMNAQLVPGTGPSSSGPNPNPPSTGLTQLYTVTGHYYLSADGAGSNTSASFSIDVNKLTAGSTVSQAYLMSTSTGNPIPVACVTLAGSTVVYTGSLTVPWYGGSFYNYWADVTSIVSPILNPAGAGITSLTITECPITNPSGGGEGLDGHALLVVFSDAAATEKTIIIMWGGQNPAGDNYSIVLGAPIDPLAVGSVLDMGLGIGYSYQPASPPQNSQVSVNSVLISSSAGGYDDGTPANGGLITVGGIGDSNTNPTDPNAVATNTHTDDELYSLLPFITNTTTNILVTTLNPSGDDNIFLSYFVLSGSAIILNGSGIVLAQSTSSGCIPTTHTVTATVVDGQSIPIPGASVNFSVTSGPNSGVTGSAITNVSGQATFTYAGSGGLGTDQIQACFLPSPTAPPVCSNILNFQWSNCNCIPTLSQWGLIILGLVLMVVATVYILRRGV